MRVPRGRFLSTTGQLTLALAGVLLALAFLGHAPSLVLLGFVVGLLPIASVLLAGSDLTGIRVVGSVDTPRLVVGSRTGLTLSFTRSAARLPSFAATVEAPHIAADPGWVEGGRATGSVVVGIEGVSHGFLRHALVQLEHLGPWGLSGVRARAMLELTPWPIVPSTRGVPAPEQPPLSTPDGDESGPGRAVTSGTDPRGMRAFRPGDEPRAVNWRATARAGSLTVREWDPPRRVPGVLIVPVLPAPAIAIAQPPGAAPAGERVLGALASLGLAASADGRAVSVMFHGTRVSSDGTTLLPDGPQAMAGLSPEELLGALAGARPAAPTPLLAVANAAVAAATPGSTVLVGIELGQLGWDTRDLLAAHAAISAAGCRLEVVTEAPPWGWHPGAREAFGALAAVCPVTPVEALIVLDTEPLAA